MLDLIDWVGRVSTVIVIVSVILGFYAWGKGIFPALWRLGNGLSKRKIALLAKGDNLRSLKSLLVDSKLFNERNIFEISSANDLGRAEQATLFLVYWHDWPNELDEILRVAKDTTALVVYAPQELGFIPQDKMKALNSKRNVMVSNFRGRLLNDIVTGLMTTSYQ